MKFGTTEYEGREIHAGNRIIIPIIRRTTLESAQGILISAVPVSILIREDETEYRINLENYRSAEKREKQDSRFADVIRT
jgi:hypothetical protein